VIALATADPAGGLGRVRTSPGPINERDNPGCVAYEVRDLGDYLDGVANGTHGRIIRQMTSSIRNELGFYARYVSTTVDGVLQPD
jgi:hypothetical protein